MRHEIIIFEGPQVQLSLASVSGTKSEFCRSVHYPNPIINNGFPKGVGRMQQSMHCIESQITIGKCNLPAKNLRDTSFKMNGFHLKQLAVEGVPKQDRFYS